jgi:anti-sigma factor RsiW
MPSQLDNLDRDAAIMLYLAGELDADDRSAYERRIAGDAQLAADVEQVRAAHSAVAGELERADGRTRLPAGESVAVRRVSRSINQWLVDREITPPTPVKRGFVMPWWSYPSSAAAILIIGFLVWSSRQEPAALPPSEAAKAGLSAADAEQQDLADLMTSSLEPRSYASVEPELDRLLSAAARPDDIAGGGMGVGMPGEEVAQ